MPSTKILKAKEKYVEELSQKLKESACGVITNYKSINVADDTMLRKSMREAGVDYFVVKNSLLSRACEKAGITGLDEHFHEETALALSKDDIIIAPKLVYGQVDKSKGAYKIKAGFIEGKAVDAGVITEYAQLPSKEVLVSKLLFMLQSPMQRLAIAASEIAKKGESDDTVAATLVVAKGAAEAAPAEAAPAAESA